MVSQTLYSTRLRLTALYDIFITLVGEVSVAAVTH